MWESLLYPLFFINNPPLVPFSQFFTCQTLAFILQCSPYSSFLSFSVNPVFCCPSFKCSSFNFQLSLSLLRCVLLDKGGISGWSAQGAAVRAALWRTALCEVACLAFVLLPRKNEGPQRGREEGGVLGCHSCAKPSLTKNYQKDHKREICWHITPIEVIWRQWKWTGNNEACHLKDQDT